MKNWTAIEIVIVSISVTICVFVVSVPIKSMIYPELVLNDTKAAMIENIAVSLIAIITLYTGAVLQKIKDDQ